MTVRVPCLVVDPGTERHGTVLRVAEGTSAVAVPGPPVAALTPSTVSVARERYNLYPHILPLGNHRYRLLVRDGVADPMTQAVLLLVYMDPVDVMVVEVS